TFLGYRRSHHAPAIVAGRFGESYPATRSPGVFILDIDAHRRGIVWTRGAQQDHEFIFLGGMDPDSVVRSKHKRTDIQGIVTLHGDPVPIQIDQPAHALYKEFLRHRRHHHPLRRNIETPEIIIWPENKRMTVPVLIGLD